MAIGADELGPLRRSTALVWAPVRAISTPPRRIPAVFCSRNCAPPNVALIADRRPAVRSGRAARPTTLEQQQKRAERAEYGSAP